MANFNIKTAGFIIVCLFAASWVVALALWRFGRTEARWDAAILAGTASQARSEGPSEVSKRADGWRAGLRW
jgi:hypothetical protein